MHKVITTAVVAAMAVGSFLGAGAASAGTPSYPNGQNVAASVVIGESDSLTLGATALNLSGAVGQTVTGTVPFTVTTNDQNGYAVQESLANPTWSNAASGGAAGDATFPLSNNSAAGTLTTTPQTAYSASSAPGPNGVNYTDAYSLVVPNVPAGTWTNSITYTLVPS